MIFNIQRYSTHDGNGIRSLIFFKGCPLHCSWCSNPESQSFTPSVLYDSRLCHNFGECYSKNIAGISPGKYGPLIERGAKTVPDALRRVCPALAITVSGEEMTTGQIMEEVMKDSSFYKSSGGGVTLSGGEPLADSRALTTLLKALRSEGIEIAVETSLHVPWWVIEGCYQLVDLFLADLKHTDGDKFRSWTGGDALHVMGNLRKLAGIHDNVIVRVPVIPGFNHSFSEMASIIGFASSLENVKEIHFLPFHNLGSRKYEMLGLKYPMDGIEKVETVELVQYKEYAETMGLKVKIGG